MRRKQLTKPFYLLEEACETLSEITGEKYSRYDLLKLDVKMQSKEIDSKFLNWFGITKNYWILRDDLQVVIDKLCQTKLTNLMLGVKEYPNMPKELAIANQVYLDLYVNRKPPTSSHKKHIENYIIEHYKDEKLSKKAIERISTIINPNPKGGIGKQI